MDGSVVLKKKQNKTKQKNHRGKKSWQGFNNQIDIIPSVFSPPQDEKQIGPQENTWDLDK